MKIERKEPARKYFVGAEPQVEISDCGNVHLEADEQLTFVTPSGKEFDFCAKSWGFYASPSINGRLASQGFKTALVENALGRVFLMAVEPEKMEDFLAYIKKESNRVLEWLDERPTKA